MDKQILNKLLKGEIEVKTNVITCIDKPVIIEHLIIPK